MFQTPYMINDFSPGSAPVLEKKGFGMPKEDEAPAREKGLIKFKDCRRPVWSLVNILHCSFAQLFLLPPDGSVTVLWLDGGIQAGILGTSYVFEAGVAIILSGDPDMLRLPDSDMKAILE